MELLKRDPPKVPDAATEYARKDISGIEYSRIYNQFLEGRDTLGLEEVDIEVEDFKAMMGIPPYTSPITLVSEFSEKWPLVSAALHGMMVRQYLVYCDELIARACKLTQDHIIVGLDARYHELIVKFNQIDIGIRRCTERGDNVGVAIATQNKIWTSLEIVYAAEDIVELRKGCGCLIHRVTERKWQMGSRRREEVCM